MWINFALPMTRTAPTPSGYLHAGNAVNFAVNALLAEQYGTGLLLRIDDLDRARFRPEYLADVFTVLDWLGIEPTQGPRDPAEFQAEWSQGYRMPLYRAALDQLHRTCARAQLFACPCSRRELADGHHAYDCPTAAIPLDRPGVAWRINTRDLPELHAAMPDFAVRRKDGCPSYQLACTVDDLHFGITHCARGEDLRASTAAQALVSDLLGYPKLRERIQFVHHPLLLATDGQKLSKRSGSQASAGGLQAATNPAAIYAQARAFLAAALPPGAVE